MNLLFLLLNLGLIEPIVTPFADVTLREDDVVEITGELSA